MSYPDLGCFAECLECEICFMPLLGAEPDLSFDQDDYDQAFGDDGPDLDDWAPPADDDKGSPFDNIPTGIPLGDDLILSPSWPPGVQIKGKFD